MGTFRKAKDYVISFMLHPDHASVEVIHSSCRYKQAYTQERERERKRERERERERKRAFYLKDDIYDLLI